MFIGIAHKTERGEPLVALVMGRLDFPDRLFLVFREIKPGAPA